MSRCRAPPENEGTRVDARRSLKIIRCPWRSEYAPAGVIFHCSVTILMKSSEVNLTCFNSAMARDVPDVSGHQRDTRLLCCFRHCWRCSLSLEGDVDPRTFEEPARDFGYQASMARKVLESTNIWITLLYIASFESPDLGSRIKKHNSDRSWFCRFREGNLRAIDYAAITDHSARTAPITYVIVIYDETWMTRDTIAVIWGFIPWSFISRKLNIRWERLNYCFGFTIKEFKGNRA